MAFFWFRDVFTTQLSMSGWIEIACRLVGGGDGDLGLLTDIGCSGISFSAGKWCAALHFT